MKLYAHQLVAEALSLLHDNNTDCFPVYDQEVPIGKITYAELMFFVGHHEIKLQFDLRTTLSAIKGMQIAQHQMAQKKARISKWVARLGTAVVLMFVLFGFTWLFSDPVDFGSGNHNDKSGPDAKNIILALSNGMHLPLDPYKEGIVVDHSKLSYNDGTVVFSRNDNRTTNLSISTARKGIYQITLPDGTRVWLNASSKLSFPSTFTGSAKRIVRLSGEAYFEVAKVWTKPNHRIPFIVLSDNQEIEVLGTHFNVRAYPKTSIKTTLVEGAVRITPLTDNQPVSADPSMTDPMMASVNNQSKRLLQSQAVVLKPDQQATLTAQQLTVSAIDAEGTIAWTKKDFTFRNMPLEAIMNVVASWYDVDIIYQEKPNIVLLGGSLQRSDQLDELLAALTLASNMHFKVHGRQVTVIKQ
ncbi:ferric-dicitrate binding protein FerR (iron transport regulator) [Pedobacter sp. AK017]|uniref:FecR family protein n=1 Tax=Pedobacter sp. AK017 TaxID=2723073 RepID=UPI001621DA37|nr:FecR domain-containing protein [Pedobacter sp. AK017]MBB5437571.1 ferric-dicitrate binding protein FerR (iron transport regulator) [Pedobacter sp. AK017]